MIIARYVCGSDRVFQMLQAMDNLGIRIITVMPTGMPNVLDHCAHWVYGQADAIDFDAVDKEFTRIINEEQ